MQASMREAVTVGFRGAGWSERAASEAEMPTQHVGLVGGLHTTLYVCRAGELEVEAAGRRLAVRAPAGCIVPEGMPQAVTGSPDCAYAIVSLDLAQLERVMPSLGVTLDALRPFGAQGWGPALVPDLCTDDLRLLLCRLAFKLSLDDDPHRLTLLGMVGDLLMEVEGRLRPEPPGALRADDVLAYLREHLADATLRGVAAHFFCHPNSIANVLRRACGASFSSVLAAMRMERAALLLRTTALTVQDVARACGYRNMTHFYALFRERYGTNPGELRRAS